MSQKYNVHIAVTRKPLALRVEGLVASLRALSEHITTIQNVKYFISLKIGGDESFFGRPWFKIHSGCPEGNQSGMS
jgi:hypothetical protein